MSEPESPLIVSDGFEDNIRVIATKPHPFRSPQLILKIAFVIASVIHFIFFLPIYLMIQLTSLSGPINFVVGVATVVLNSLLLGDYSEVETAAPIFAIISGIIAAIVLIVEKDETD